MSLILWSRYRRQGLRKAWRLAGMNQTVAYVAAGLFSLFSAYAFVAWFESSMEDAERIGWQAGADHREGLERDVKALYFSQVSEHRGLE